LYMDGCPRLTLAWLYHGVCNKRLFFFQESYLNHGGFFYRCQILAANPELVVVMVVIFNEATTADNYN